MLRLPLAKKVYVDYIYNIVFFYYYQSLSRYKSIIVKKKRKRKEKIEFERMFKRERLTIKKNYFIIYMSLTLAVIVIIDWILIL